MKFGLESTTTLSGADPECQRACQAAADSGLIAMGDPTPNCLTSTLRRIQAPSFFSGVFQVKHRNYELELAVMSTHSQRRRT